MTVIRPMTAFALLRADALNVARDPILMVGMVLSVLPAPLLVAFGATAEAWAWASFGFSGMALVLGALAVLMPGAMIGWITGFLLLEDRDETVLMAMEITPVGKTGFITYRLVVCAILTLALALATALAVLPGLPVALALGAAAIAAGHGVVSALFLLAFAGNKVEGLALNKLINLVLLAPLLALFPAPWRYLAAPVPPFWIGELAALSPNPAPPALAMALGLAGTAALVALLTHLVRRRLG